MPGDDPGKRELAVSVATLVGILPQDFDHGVDNLMAKPAGELEERKNRLLAGQKVLGGWREQHGITQSCTPK